mgnify:CR=1 FL=1
MMNHQGKCSYRIVWPRKAIKFWQSLFDEQHIDKILSRFSIFDVHSKAGVLHCLTYNILVVTQAIHHQVQCHIIPPTRKDKA